MNEVIEVVEGEIIDSDAENTAIEKKESPSPPRPFAYKLGVFAGSLLSLVGVVSEAGALFKRNKDRKNSGAGMKNGSGGRWGRRRKKMGL